MLEFTAMLSLHCSVQILKEIDKVEEGSGIDLSMMCGVTLSYEEKS